jgi:hypothetical protein
MSTLTTSPMTPDRWKSLTSSERAHIRQFQLKRIEQEQLLEEKEALKMTEVRYFSTLFTISGLMILWDRRKRGKRSCRHFHR